MKRTFISKAAGVVAILALASALLPAIGAQAGVKVPRSEDTLNFPLPDVDPLGGSWFVEVGDKSFNTPTLTDANVALHYIMEGQSGDTVIEGAVGNYCDDRPNSPNEVLRVYKENAKGSLDIDATITGTSTNTGTGASESFSQRIPESGTVHLAAGGSGSTPILRLCK